MGIGRAAADVTLHRTMQTVTSSGFIAAG